MTFKTVIALVFLALLQGCGVPGFGKIEVQRIGGARPQTERQYIIGYAPVVENPENAGEIPDGAIIPITANLVRMQSQAQSKSLPDDVAKLFGKPPVYTIGPGDVVGIIVYDHPELLPNAGAVISQASDPTGVSVAPGFIVSSTGEVSFPYVGRIRMAGLTEIEASDLITQRIAKYIKDPQVTVRIASFRSQRAFIEGEVRLPGLQVFTDVPMTLAEAISRAGGITINGDRAFITLTRGSSTTVINLQQLQELGADAGSIPLKNGDLITVKNREESKAYVMGEIARPSAILFRNGKLSLSEALGEAGGPNLQTSDTGQIYVVRNGRGDSVEVFHLDAKNPIAFALADRFNLRPRDVVYLDPVPLVAWNRVLSLIIPAAQVFGIGNQAVTR